MKEVIGASSTPGVISTPSGQTPVVVLTLLLQEGPSTQQIQVRLTEAQAAGLMRVLKAGFAQTANIQPPPDNLQ